MRGVHQSIRQWLFPPIPVTVADEFAILTAGRLQSQSRLLFLALLVTVPAAAWASSPNMHWIVRFGFPAIMGICCLLGFLSLGRDLGIAGNARRSRALLVQSTYSSSFLAVLCSSWCVLCWIAAPPENRIYYPLIVAMGALATAYCMSGIRVAALLHLCVDLLPMSFLLLFAGNRLDFAAGTSILVAAVFLLRMIVHNHDMLVDLLLLKRQMRDLSETDPLTGLRNRRGLDAKLDLVMRKVKPDQQFAVALFDLDGFKPVNDTHGHAAGDQLLSGVAARIRDICGDEAHTARLGGDEFAILFPPAVADQADAMVSAVLMSLVKPFDIADQSIRIGASAGLSYWPKDATTIPGLFDHADRGVYDAKALGRAEKPIRQQAKAA